MNHHDKKMSESQRYNIPKLELYSDLHDSGTQTSKTILELAKMEMAKISPDSLMSSPKECDSLCNSEDDVSEEQPKQHACRTSFNRRQYVYNDATPTNDLNKSLIEMFLAKSKVRSQDPPPDAEPKTRFLQQMSPLRYIPKHSSLTLKSQSCVETKNDVSEFPTEQRSRNRFKVKNVREFVENDETKPVKYFCPEAADAEKFPRDAELLTPRGKECCNAKKGSSFMGPTISSENKNKLPEIQCLNKLISSPRRGRSYSPEERRGAVESYGDRKNKIPYIDQSEESLKDSSSDKNQAQKRDIQMADIKLNNPVPRTSVFEEDLLKIDQLSLNLSSECDLTGSVRVSNSTSSIDNAINSALSKVRERDWNMALKGLAEVIELCRLFDTDFMFPHMTTVNQRLIELLRSSRSHVCRTACQAAGHLFELVKDTRRPEFDDMVNILLCKTADANKFIRKDANLALDCMVTHISTFHAVRTLCAKGPIHKNDLVRTATARLLVCAVVIAGTENILNQNAAEHTRKRLIINMEKFIEDKSLETRKYGERLYKILSRETSLEMHLKKYLEKDQIAQMKKSLKLIEKRR